jgi:CBS domain containing-hemolysin-like protein
MVPLSSIRRVLGDAPAIEPVVLRTRRLVAAFRCGWRRILSGIRRMNEGEERSSHDGVQLRKRLRNSGAITGHSSGGLNQSLRLAAMNE